MGTQIQQSSFYLTPQQQQSLQFLQQNGGNLTVSQQNLLHEIQQFRIEQHQAQIRQQQQPRPVGVGVIRPTGQQFNVPIQQVSHIRPPVGSNVIKFPQGVVCIYYQL